MINSEEATTTGHKPASMTSPDPPKEFWSHFDTVGDEHVAQLAKTLNSQLDQQIIFATLFSAINSSFLIYSLPNLSDPVQQTTGYLNLMVKGYNNPAMTSQADSIASSGNTPLILNIIINQLFSASLICSLIAAFFAVLGKQWLTYFSNQSRGSPEYVRPDVQNKILGAEIYKLRTVLEAALPLIFQASLLLFLVGLVIFLFTINRDVAYAVIPLAASGLIAYFVFVLLAVWDPTCPYQTPITETLIPAVGKLVPHIYLVLKLFVLVPKRFLGDLLDSLQLCCGMGRRKQRVRINEAIQSATSRAKPDWDTDYHDRLALAKKLRRSRSTTQTNIMTAAWVARTSQEEGDARIAAETFLEIKTSSDVAMLGGDKDLIRRFRSLVLLTDDDVDDESSMNKDALSGARLKQFKSRDKGTLSFYIEVLTHIFLSLETPDAKWYDTMYRIYRYQSQCAENGGDWENDNLEGSEAPNGPMTRSNSETNYISAGNLKGDLAKFRAWGILKLLLYWEGHRDARSRLPRWDTTLLYDEIYRFILHEMSVGQDLSAVSYGAFAMTMLLSRQRIRASPMGLAPFVMMNDRQSTSSSANGVLPEADDDHTKLWNAYAKRSANLVGNIVDFLKKFAELYPFNLDWGRRQDNSLEHFYTFLKAIESATLNDETWNDVVGSTRELVAAYAGIINSFRNVRTNVPGTWIVPLELDGPVLALLLKTIRKAMEIKAEDVVVELWESIAEACRTLVILHKPLGRDHDPDLMEVAILAMEKCRQTVCAQVKLDDNAPVKLGGSKHGVFLPLIQATGAMVIRYNEETNVRSDRGLELIDLGVGVMEEFIRATEPLNWNNSRFQSGLASTEGMAAMRHFLTCKKDGMDDKQKQFIRKHLRAKVERPTDGEAGYNALRDAFSQIISGDAPVGRQPSVTTATESFSKQAVPKKSARITFRDAVDVQTFKEDEPSGAIKPVPQKQEEQAGLPPGGSSNAAQSPQAMV